ncbi:MAG: YajG family lipoprotein, partial [Halomonas sp.]
MLRRQFIRMSGVLLASAWLAGCASPQYLQLSPERNADVPQTGSGQQVTVIAQDGRDSDIIGNRAGGNMSTAQITVSSHELIPRLQEEA